MDKITLEIRPNEGSSLITLLDKALYEVSKDLKAFETPALFPVKNNGFYEAALKDRKAFYQELKAQINVKLTEYRNKGE